MSCRPPWEQSRPVHPTPELDAAVRREEISFWLPAAVATLWVGVTVAVAVWSVL